MENIHKDIEQNEDNFLKIIKKIIIIFFKNILRFKQIALEMFKFSKFQKL